MIIVAYLAINNVYCNEKKKQMVAEVSKKEEEETDFLSNVTHILSIINVRSSTFSV